MVEENQIFYNHEISNMLNAKLQPKIEIIPPQDQEKDKVRHQGHDTTLQTHETQSSKEVKEQRKTQVNQEALKL